MGVGYTHFETSDVGQFTESQGTGVAAVKAAADARRRTEGRLGRRFLTLYVL